jgi:hypothetical protein
LPAAFLYLLDDGLGGWMNCDDDVVFDNYKDDVGKLNCRFGILYIIPPSPFPARKALG